MAFEFAPGEGGSTRVRYTPPPMDRHARLTFVCLGLVLVLAALGVKKPGLPMQVQGEEPTWVAMAQSLAFDGDLRFERGDAERLFADFPFVDRPSFALRSADGWQHAELDLPLLYPLLAAPLVRVFGSNGLAALNLLLLLIAIAVAAGHLRRDNDSAPAWLFASAFFLLSLAWVYAFHPRPEILALCAVTVLFAAGLRAVDATGPAKGRLGAGLLSGVMLLPLLDLEPAWLWLALPIVGLAVVRRRWRALGGWAIGTTLALILAAFLAPPAGEGWEQATVELENPLVWPLPPAESAPPVRWHEPSTARRTLHFFLGKHTGLLPYFPLLLVALYLAARALSARDPAARSGRGESLWISLGIGLTMVTIPSLDAASFPEEVTGNPWLVPIYPAFLFLLSRLRTGAVVAAFALGTWTLGALLWTPFGSVAPGASSQAHVRGAPFAWLPTEVELLPGLPGYQRFALPDGTLWSRYDQVTLMGEDLWLLGGEEVELWFESDSEAPRAAVDLRNLADPQRLEVSFDDQTQVLDYADLPPRGESRRLELDLAPPNRRLRSAAGEEVLLHRLEIDSERGASPSWSGLGRHHYTGAVLTWLGEPERLQRDLYAAEWLGCGAPQQVEAGELFLALSRLRNASPHPWPAQGGARVRLAYHWLDVEGEMVVRDGLRTELSGEIEPGEVATLWQTVEAPDEPGSYLLELEPIFERVSWFADRDPAASCRAEVEVEPASVEPEP